MDLETSLALEAPKEIYSDWLREQGRDEEADMILRRKNQNSCPWHKPFHRLCGSSGYGGDGGDGGYGGSGGYSGYSGSGGSGGYG